MIENARAAVVAPLDTYDRAFFSELEDGSLRSARAVVPVLVDVLRPASVVDVGCGSGAWLRAFHEQGVRDLLGLDGPWLPADSRMMRRRQFRVADLTRPFRLRRRFDLAVSLEVGEHLPESSAPGFVASLTRLAPVVVFSAAVPYQGGTNHVNEQWPEYWVRLFEARGFGLIDCLRPLLWADPRIEPWYAQNSLLFLSPEDTAEVTERVASLPRVPESMLSLVHPRLPETLMAAPLDGDE